VSECDSAVWLMCLKEHCECVQEVKGLMDQGCSKEEQQHVQDMLVALTTRHHILLAFIEEEETEDEKERLDSTIRRFVATPRAGEPEEKKSDWQYRWQGGLQMTLEVHGKLPAEHRQTCCVCWTDLSQVCLNPCGHLCMCIKCAEKSGASQRSGICPICNTIVQGAVKFLTPMQAKEEDLVVAGH